MMNPPLPKRLHYLKPFIRQLESLPPDELNEDVDPTLLEQALRKRLSGSDPERTLEGDRHALEEWLAGFESQQHPAHWISGFLFSITPADLLESDGDHGPGLSRIEVEPPPGWTVSANGAELRKGELIAKILPIDDLSFGLLEQQLAAPLKMPPPIVATRTYDSATYGDSTGYKSVYQQSAPKSWKQVDYLLAIRGGHVLIQVCARGADFDEKELESSLHTLSAIQSTE